MGEAPPNIPMSLDTALRARRSVRGFRPDPVSPSLLKEIFTLAQLTPSNCNTQPWVPHIVSGKTLETLRAALLAAGSADAPPAPDWKLDMRNFTGIYRTRQVDAAVQLYSAMGIERNDLPGRRDAHLRNLAFFGAPHAVFIFMPHLFDTREAADLGMYAQTLMLLLTSRGLASCAQGALGLYPDIIREVLNVTSEYRLLFGISFGYEDEAEAANQTRVGREALHSAVTFHE